METPAGRTTTAEADEGADGLPEKCGVERMSDANGYESRLWRLLEEQKLADLSQFHRRGFFDEVPLYSRESDIQFLPHDENEATKVLLGFALKFLQSVVAYERHPAGYFAAVTVWDFSDDPIVPNLFVWCDTVRGLEEKLALKATKTRFAKRIKKLVPGLGLGDPFDILEDTSTVPDTPRVVYLPARLPYPGFASLDHFRRPMRAAK